MTGIRIPSLPPIVAPDGDDLLPIEDVSTSTTKKITLTQIKEWFQSLVGWITAGMLGTNACTRNDGWISTADTWVYVSPTSFKIVGVDVTAKYKKGALFMFTQTSVKYGVSAGASMSGSDTLVTTIPNTNYTIANAAITNNFYSYAANPQGFPGVFDYNPTLSVAGGTVPTYSTKSCKFSVSGNAISAECTFVNSIGGTAGNGLNVIDVPLPIAAIVGTTHGFMRIYNGGTLINGKAILDCFAVDNGGSLVYMSSEGYNIIGNDQSNANRYMQMNFRYLF